MSIIGKIAKIRDETPRPFLPAGIKVGWFKKTSTVMVFLVGCFLSGWLLFSSPEFVGTDDYYHTRISLQIIEQGNLRLDFPWLPLTILTPEQFVDHHLLYHLYLAPWMKWGGIPAVKLAQSILIGGIGVLFLQLLRYLNVHYAIIWTLALLGLSSPFLYRMLMIRTQAAAVLFLLITLHVLFRKRYKWLFILSFAFTWLYNGFILIFVVVVLHMMAIAITEHQFVWRGILYCLFGITIGLVVNPYFPENIAFISSHLGEKISLNTSIRVGSEWYPYTTLELLENSTGMLIVFGLGIIANNFRKYRRDAIETTILFIALFTLFMLFRSRRFIEYFPIFALLFCAVAWGRHTIENEALLLAKLKIPSMAYPALMLIPTVLLSTMVIKNVQADIQNARNLGYMAGAARWLELNTTSGELVFQTDWDDFPYLFHHNTHNRYLIGLDPTYLQIANPIMWNQWIAITQGTVKNPSTLIKDLFDARLVVSDTHHQNFAVQADSDPNMRLVYRDKNSLIWRIVDG